MNIQSRKPHRGATGQGQAGQAPGPSAAAGFIIVGLLLAVLVGGLVGFNAFRSQ